MTIPCRSDQKWAGLMKRCCSGRTLMSPETSNEKGKSVFPTDRNQQAKNTRAWRHTLGEHIFRTRLETQDGGEQAEESGGEWLLSWQHVSWHDLSSSLDLKRDYARNWHCTSHLQHCFTKPAHFWPLLQGSKFYSRSIHARRFYCSFIHYMLWINWHMILS